VSNEKPKIGYIGIMIGSISLLLALAHFWAGPFSPQQPLEVSIAQKAAAIRNNTIAALKGEKIEKESMFREYDADDVVNIITVLLGGLAIIIGVIAFAKKESYRVAGGAAMLGSIGIALQYFSFAIGAIVFAIILAAILSQLDFDFF
jgi:hypothetical protein